MKPMKIVGVVGNVRQQGPTSEPEAEIYMPYLQHPQPATNMRVIVRTNAEPGVITAAMREKMRTISPDVPAKFSTMEQALSENIAAPRFRTLLLGIFAGLAVCLALAGVYGVMSYVVGQRANEIGLRMALGASPGEILRLVLRQAMVLAGAGDCDRVCGGGSGYAVADEHVVRGEADRSGDVCGGDWDCAGGGAAGELHPGATSDAG